jgi:hypothetical protein
VGLNQNICAEPWILLVLSRKSIRVTFIKLEGCISRFRLIFTDNRYETAVSHILQLGDATTSPMRYVILLVWDMGISMKNSIFNCKILLSVSYSKKIRGSTFIDKEMIILSFSKNNRLKHIIEIFQNKSYSFKVIIDL